MGRDREERKRMMEGYKWESGRRVRNLKGRGIFDGGGNGKFFESFFGSWWDF